MAVVVHNAHPDGAHNLLIDFGNQPDIVLRFTEMININLKIRGLEDGTGRGSTPSGIKMASYRKLFNKGYSDFRICRMVYVILNLFQFCFCFTLSYHTVQDISEKPNNTAPQNINNS